MPLAPGTQLGAYEILSQIGSGGMGEVYKALDPKLDRLVAIKVLPGAMAGDDPVRARFEREAKAVAALSHPNILGIFDFQWDGSLAYAVMELLEGQTLREALKEGPLPPKKAVDLALQVAHGLAAAHDKGIVHRDLKPENVFLTRDHRVKLLDFGLAKQVVVPDPARTQAESGARPQSGSHATQAGTLLGTLGYMSPEQVRGEEVDPRSDIFSFGVMLFELLTGQRPFARRSAGETISAILRDEPGALTGTRGPSSPALERVVLRCLEKRPEDRFQSMKDLAFALEAPSQVSDAFTFSRPRRGWRFGRGRGWLAAGLLLLAGAGAWGAGWLRLGRSAPPPTFHRLMYTPGTVESAFFGPDGRTIYFSARLQGGPPGIYVIASNSPEPKALGLEDALLLQVSEDNELTVLKHPRRWTLGRYRGLLAQVSGGGGAERALLEDAEEAAWDGQGMAVVTHDDALRLRVEFPAGHTVLSAQGFSHGVKLLRLSRDRQRLALVEGTDGRTELVVFRRDGGREVRFTKPGDGYGDTLTGLAWGPGGTLWLSELQEDQTAVWILSPGGSRRLAWRGEGAKQLLDVSPEGRLLLADQVARRGVLVQSAGEAGYRERSLQNGTQCQGLSADGRTLLLLESPALDGGTAEDLAFLQDIGGASPLRLGKGNPYALSPDGGWIQMNFNGLRPEDLDSALVAAFQRAGLQPREALDPVSPRPYLCFIPAGLGAPFVLRLPPTFDVANVAFLHPDGRTVVFQGSEKGHGLRYYRMDRAGGTPEPVTDEGYGHNIVGISPLSPDGSRLVVTTDRKAWFLVSTAGGALTPIQGLRPEERVIGWSRDGRGLYVRPELSVLPLTVDRLDPATGHRVEVHRFMPPDPSGYLQTRTVWMTPDARTFAFTYDRKLSELYLVEGLR